MEQEIINRNEKRLIRKANREARKPQKVVTLPMLRTILKQHDQVVNELKFFVQNVEYQSVDYGGVVQSLTDVTLGDTDQQRDGDALKPVSMVGRGFFTFPNSNPDSYNIVRLVIFRWIPTSFPSVNNILLTNGGSPNAPLAHYTSDYKDSYKILFDQTSYISQSCKTVSLFNFFVKEGPQILFSNQTTAGSNKIYYLVLTDSAVAGHPTFSISTKFSFYDS